MEVLIAGLVAMLLAAAVAAVGSLFISIPVMWLWNAVLPAIVGVHPLTWLQALCLSILCALLFKGSYSK